MISSMTQSQQRVMLKAFVRPEAKRAVEDLITRTGMTQQELVSRVYEWFGSQDEIIQHTVLGLLPKDYAPEIAGLVMAKLAPQPHAVTVEDLERMKKNYPAEESSPDATSS